MSPDDEQRINDDTTTATIWQPMPIQTDNNLIKTHVIKNGTNGVVKDTDNSHKWTPLLRIDNFQNGKEEYRANNNEWSQNGNNGNFKTEHLATEWTDKLDMDNNHSQLIKNNNSQFVNGKGIVVNGINHTDKLAELDLLTGTSVPRTLEPDSEERANCGIGSCQPLWARSFASTHVFMVVFLLAWILQGMYYTYFVSVITTIEKLFQIKSKTTGLLMSATEVGQISTSLFLTYYAGNGNRPKWIACSMVLFAIASFGCTLPHFIFGDQLLHANNVFNTIGHNQQHYGLDKSALAIGNMLNSDGTYQSLVRAPDYQSLCYASENNTSYMGEKDCQDEILVEQASHNQLTAVILVIFVLSLLGVGIGQTAVSTLGIPYIDDNVASRESPIYIAITIGVRILGPAAGFILGSFCTKIYVDLSDPGFGTSDPRWVGAWWLGLVIVSSCMGITSLAMFAFPRNLRGNRIPAPMKVRAIEEQKKLEKQEEECKTPKIKDFPKTIKRQLSNDILMCRTASSVLHLLPVAGLYTFLPKYLETQFRLAAHDANLIAGIGGILVMGVGIIISGVVILKFNPTARSVAAWIAFTAIVYAAGMAILMFVGCPMNDFAGLREVDSIRKFEPVCNGTCPCDIEKFSPICGADGMTYFSSCHAGCSTSAMVEGKMQFYNCTCIPPESNFFDKPEATSGYCDGKCKSFVLFISLFSFFVFMHSTSEVGSMLLIMRCTDPKDKAMAMGVIQFAIGLFGNVPCPIIYGAVVDSACLVWETICGKQGACSLYDIDMFRHFFLGTTAGIMALAFVMDLVVWHKAHRIDIDPESSTTSETDFEKPITVVPESSV